MLTDYIFMVPILKLNERLFVLSFLLIFFKSSLLASPFDILKKKTLGLRTLVQECYQNNWPIIRRVQDPKGEWMNSLWDSEYILNDFDKKYAILFALDQKDINILKQAYAQYLDSLYFCQETLLRDIYIHYENYFLNFDQRICLEKEKSANEKNELFEVSGYPTKLKDIFVGKAMNSIVGFDKVFKYLKENDQYKNFALDDSLDKITSFRYIYLYNDSHPDKSKGSAFYSSKNGTIISACHLFSFCYDQSLKNKYPRNSLASIFKSNGGESVKLGVWGKNERLKINNVEVLYVDHIEDLIVLKDKSPSIKINPVLIDFGEPLLGERVHIIGFSSSLDPLKSDGIIFEIGNKIKNSAYNLPGHCGAPVETSQEKAISFNSVQLNDHFENSLPVGKTFKQLIENNPQLADIIKE